MKIFLGWSGDTSHKVALALREWLPFVIQNAKPWVSSEDISKGVRWSLNLAKELETSRFGIICVTRENWATPWINFEAGALSKEMDQAGVSPFLFDVRASEIHGPLVQFQYVASDKEDIFKLLKSINERESSEQRLNEGVLRKGFEKWWPDLSQEFQKIERETIPKPIPSALPEPAVMLAELLEIVRAMQREAWAVANREKAEREASIADLRMRLEQLDGIVGRSVGTVLRSVRFFDDPRGRPLDDRIARPGAEYLIDPPPVPHEATGKISPDNVQPSKVVNEGDGSNGPPSPHQARGQKNPTS